MTLLGTDNRLFLVTLLVIAAAQIVAAL